MRRLVLALLLAFAPAIAWGQQISSLVSPSSVLGTYTIATLPTPSPLIQGKYAFATDLGGGADAVICDGTYWKHIRLGSPTVMAPANGTVTVTPLASAQVLIVNGTIATTMNLAINPVGLYPGYMLYVRVPGLITGSLGVSLAGTTFPLLGNSTSMFIYDGTSLQRIQ